MGICGTEVAKEASDIVILDDNFASIIKVVRWGRAVFFNIQKFIQFQMTVNLVALAINFVSAVGSGYAPLTAVQVRLSIGVLGQGVQSRN
jgi:Ca2+-transporting ATPase